MQYLTNVGVYFAEVSSIVQYSLGLILLYTIYIYIYKINHNNYYDLSYLRDNILDLRITITYT